MMDIPDLRRRMCNPETRQRACIEVGDWFRDLCLLFGVEFDTAVQVGAIATYGLYRDLAKQEQKIEAKP